MSRMLTIQLSGPIAAVRVVGTPHEVTTTTNARSCAEDPQGRVQHAGTTRREPCAELDVLERPTQELTHLCETVGSIVEKLGRLYEETIAQHRTEIARLAVEIAGKILSCRTSRGDYDIDTIIAEALKRVPTHQEITVRVSPDDLPQCQQLQQDNPHGPLAALNLVADESIARADCVVETPTGMVRSFVDEQLERIGEALMKVE